jgi:hypothetical protein
MRGPGVGFAVSALAKGVDGTSAGSASAVRYV